MRPDQALLTDHRPVQHRRSHPNQAFIPDRAGVHVRRMPDRDPVADEARKVIREVQDRVVLDVRMMSDLDPVDVAPQHRPIPDAAVVPERHITHNHRRPGEIDTSSQPRRAPQVAIQLPDQPFHPTQTVNLFHPLTLPNPAALRQPNLPVVRSSGGTRQMP